MYTPPMFVPSPLAPAPRDCPACREPLLLALFMIVAFTTSGSVLSPCVAPASSCWAIKPATCGVAKLVPLRSGVPIGGRAFPIVVGQRQQRARRDDVRLHPPIGRESVRAVGAAPG